MRRRSLLIIIVTLLTVLIAFFISGRLHAPEPQSSSSRYQDGNLVTLEGEVVCLEHIDQDGPQTLECAYGFKDENGDFYALQDTSTDYSTISGVPMNEKVRLEGTFRTATSETYIQVGKIEVVSIIKLQP